MAHDQRIERVGTGLVDMAILVHPGRRRRQDARIRSIGDFNRDGTRLFRVASFGEVNHSLAAEECTALGLKA
jgi:hypothetical protein